MHSVDCPHTGRKKQKRTGEKMHSKTQIQLNIYGGHCISIASSFLGQLRHFSSARADQLQGTRYC